jgi:threonine aldolase
VDVPGVATNIVFFDVGAPLATANYLARKAPVPGAEDITADTDLTQAFASLVRALSGGARVGAYGGGRLRAVTHHQIRDEDVEAFLQAAEKAAALLSPPPPTPA